MGEREREGGRERDEREGGEEREREGGRERGREVKLFMVLRSNMKVPVKL